jgi:DNA-binding winged helix-turn-helix (wHTH) protein
VRFRFDRFVVSPAHRILRDGDRDVPLIPRYFDLLVLLIAERHRAVTRQEIFDRVWGDVVVSDGALSQAIRTIRRCLGDDPREPRFVRTVSRHGYQFVWLDVVEVPDEGPMPVAARPAVPEAPFDPEDKQPDDPFSPLLDRLLRRPPFAAAGEEERREAAEQLLALGTDETLRRLDGVDGHAEARAILRDARWDVPGAGDVSLLGGPQPLASIAHVVRLRLRRAARETSNRWASASLGGAVAGVVAGFTGGAALWLVPESQAAPGIVIALAVIGGIAGALGAAGIGAGLATAEALARSSRAAALTMCGAVAGAISAVIVHQIARALLVGVFGRDVAGISSWPEGMVLGAAAGLGYAISTRRLSGGGLASPRGAARLRAAVITGVACAIAGVVMAAAGRHLVASSLDLMAAAFDGSDVGLAPLARLLGEQDLRPVTRGVVSAFEGLLFGAGLAFGLVHRPRRL